ncbi:MAG TPA: hypothetical protein VHO25_02810, partial [Polyangiaceae bacterium]|nr:hypothetical protein [Polyangiaceae bacterium]
RLAPCTLRLMRSDTFDMIELDAQVVLVSDAEPMRGVAVQLTSADWRQQLATFAGVELAAKAPASPPAAVRTETAAAPSPAAEAEEPPAITPRVSVSAALLAGAKGTSAATSSSETNVPEASEAVPSAAAAAPDEDDERYANREQTERRQRIRNMSAADRGRVAHGSNLEDRVLLERIFGSAVWEMLLRSTTLTPPEVANIARKGSLSVPLIELVADNPNWIRQDVVRRALLSNPRIPPHTIMKVLHAVPRNELKIMAEGATTYPAKVRSALQTLRGKKS